MIDTDLLVLDDEVRGSLSETLVLRGSLAEQDVIVFFAAEVLDHWPRETQAERLNEMRAFVERATRRALDQHEFSEVHGMFADSRDALIVVLGWADIAS